MYLFIACLFSQFYLAVSVGCSWVGAFGEQSWGWRVSSYFHMRWCVPWVKTHPFLSHGEFCTTWFLSFSVFLSLHVSVGYLFWEGQSCEVHEWCQHSVHECWWYGMFLFNIKFYYNKVYFHKNTFSLKKQKVQWCFFWGQGLQRGKWYQSFAPWGCSTAFHIGAHLSYDHGASYFLWEWKVFASPILEA